jgi:hypothetical protein
MSGIVQATAVPAHLQKYLGENKHYGGDFGTLKPSDFGVGFIKLCHGQSREAK